VVALKLLRSTHATARERLRRDAAVLSSVCGDHVVRVRDVVVMESQAVVVMEHAAGGNLASILAAREVLTAPEVVTLVGPLAMALADAHDRGLVHGAVTAANIVFTEDGRPMLSDFGLASLIGDRPTDVTAAEADDVHALCSVAVAALDRESAPAALVAAIDAGVAGDPHGRPSARDLGAAVLRSCGAAPIRLAASVAPVMPGAAAPSSPSPPPPLPRAPGSAGEPRHAQSPSRRLLGPAVAVALLAVVAVVGVSWDRGSGPVAAVLPPSPSAGPTVAAQTTKPVSWLAVVRALDRRRAVAFTTADPRKLSDVYVAGSSALAADLATLHAMSSAGLTARGFVIMTVGVQPLRQAASSAVLRVTDALSRYRLFGPDGQLVRSVPARHLRSSTMTLTRVRGEWRIARVSR
jgi:eukaryotic-like serine/threonine-protein kinase